MSDLSLRERGKQRRRAAILSAAMRLFAEHGYEATTIADVAAAAEVAPRSVSMYFPSKVDLALASSTASLSRLLENLRGAARDIPIVDVYTSWLAAEPPTVGADEWKARAAMLAANPMLGGVAGSLDVELGDEICARLMVELGLEPSDPTVRMLFGLFSGTLLQFHLLPSVRAAEAGSLAARTALTGALDAVRASRDHT